MNEVSHFESSVFLIRIGGLPVKFLLVILSLVICSCGLTSMARQPSAVGEQAVASKSYKVSNAGLVLLNAYQPTLFKRLNLLNGNSFRNEAAQESAVNYLQQLATGSNAPNSDAMTLNKVLCGLAPTTTVKPDLAPSEQDQQLLESLLQSVISQWQALGSSTIAGFRGNWLVRDGLLTEAEDRWDLTVEKRAYDILLEKAPFSFSVIKYPWMKKPLYVHWN